MVKSLPFLLLPALLFVSNVGRAQSPIQQLSQNTNQEMTDGPYIISVITIGPGDELFARFGHIALMVEDQGRRQQLVYNYGTFEFDDPKLRFKYARGFLNYWLSVVPFDVFFYYYAEGNRDMWVQTLNLSPEKAAAVADALAENAKPENRYYLYRHFLDNCCTRIRNVLDAATDGAIARQFKSTPVDRDFRYWTAKCLDGLPLYRSVILYSLGPAIDQPLTRWDEEFLPMVFFEDVGKVTYGKNNIPLVAKTEQILERQGPPIGTVVPDTDIIVIAILFGIFILGFGIPLFAGNKKWARRVLGVGLFFWGLLAGLGSLMLLLYWTATTHYDTHYNENLLVNPIFHLWLLGPAVALIINARLRPLTQKVIYWYLIGAMGLIAFDVLLKIGPFVQGNWGTIALAVVLNGAALAGLKRVKALSADV